jgi:hypothetical protein
MTQDEVVKKQEIQWLRSCFKSYDVDEDGLGKIADAIIGMRKEIQDYQKLREKIKDKDNRLWGIIRCNACNGTTDCENSPECPENYDGCIADDILKEMQAYLQQPTEH